MKERIKQGIRKILKENIDVSEHEDYTDYKQLILSIGSYMERNSIKTKTKMMDKSKCCNENTIKYSSTGVKGDVNTHYTCTNCGKINDKPKQR
tara:strand:+ start:4123 stop:4401 length:279 start_codon:yes stop_codon:yes gene_type:complete